MDKQITLSLNDILEKDFNVDFKGYSMEEVDQFLDTIITDYQTYGQLVEAYQAKVEADAAKINDLTGALETAKAFENDLAEAENTLESVREDLAVKETVLSTTKARNLELETSLAEANEAKATLASEAEALAHTADELRLELAKAKAAYETLQAELEASKAELEEYKQANPMVDVLKRLAKLEEAVFGNH